MSYSVICRKKETFGIRWELLNDRIYLFIYLFIIYLPVSLFTILFIYSFIHLFIDLFMHLLFIHYLIYLFTFFAHSFINVFKFLSELSEFILLLKSQNCETNSELWRNTSHNCEIKTQLLDINSQLWENIIRMRSQVRKSKWPYLTFSSELQDVISEFWERKSELLEKSEFIYRSSEEKARFNSELWKE